MMPPSVGSDDDRRDLAAMMVPLGRALTAAEQPILATHGLTMWAYVVLMALGDQTVRTQAALAAAIGADKTRIIPVLDNLQERGLIDRRPDPLDRRGHSLSLSPAGQTTFHRAQAAIRQHERRLLDKLTDADRRGFLRALDRLSRLSWRELTAPEGDE